MHECFKSIRKIVSMKQERLRSAAKTSWAGAVLHQERRAWPAKFGLASSPARFKKGWGRPMTSVGMRSKGRSCNLDSMFKKVDSGSPCSNSVFPFAGLVPGRRLSTTTLPDLQGFSLQPINACFQQALTPKQLRLKKHCSNTLRHTHVAHRPAQK